MPSNVGRLQSARKVLIRCLEMLSLDIFAAQSPATIEREHYEPRSNSTYLWISQPQPSRPLQHFLAGRADHLGGSTGNVIVVDETGDEHHWRGQRIGLDGVGRSQLEELLGAHFRKEG